MSPKRPWLAALLGLLVTGLGHLYLRRWRRAFGWLAILFGTTVLFVDPAAVDALASWSHVDLREVAPILLVGGLSVLDVYRLAHAHNAVARRSEPTEGRPTDCPNCGKELDTTLDFCHWCTTKIDERTTANTDAGNPRG